MYVPTVSVDDVTDPTSGDWVVLDVREPYEWAAGHIEGAVHIPLGDLPARVDELDPHDRTVVVCSRGRPVGARHGLAAPARSRRREPGRWHGRLGGRAASHRRSLTRRCPRTDRGHRAVGWSYLAADLRREPALTFTPKPAGI